MLSDSASPAELRLPTGQQVYDALMVDIEKELLAGNAQDIDAAHADETPDQRQQRYERYLEAFINFDKAFAALTAQLHQAVETCKQNELSRDNIPPPAREDPSSVEHILPPADLSA